MADVERRPQAIPWDYFADIPEKRNWTDLALTLDRAKGYRAFRADAIEKLPDSIVMTNANLSLRGKEGSRRHGYIEVDQRTTTIKDGVTVGTVVSATNTVYEDTKATPTEHLFFNVTVVDPLPSEPFEAATTETTVQVAFDKDGKVLYAKLLNLDDYEEEDEGVIIDEKDESNLMVLDTSQIQTQQIESGTKVKHVLRRMGITDPQTQRINTTATLQALVEGVSDKIDDNTEDVGTDILRYFKLADVWDTIWTQMPQREGYNPENN